MTEVLDGQLSVHQMSLPFGAASQVELACGGAVEEPEVRSTVISLEERRFMLGRERVLKRLFDSGLLHLKLS